MGTFSDRVEEIAGKGVISRDIGYNEVTAKEASRLLKEEDCLVVDVRQKEQFEREHIEGAVLIPVGTMKDRVAELPRDQRIFLVCEDGTKSMLACELLMAAGFPSEDLYNIIDGMPACRRQGYPLKSGK